MKIDLRFFQIEYEIWALQEYFDTTQRQLPDLIKLERKRLHEAWNASDEDEWQLEQQEITELTENVLPRFFRGPIIVAAWAIYESGFTEIANYFQKRDGHTLGIRDIKGNNTLDSARKYFDNILKFPLFKDEREKENLEKLLVLRNAIAHGNGRRDAVNPNYWKQFEKWEAEGKGISTSFYYLSYSPTFIEEILKVVSNALNSLVERARDFN